MLQVLNGTQIRGLSIWQLFRITNIAGWLLLSRPLIYFIFSRRRDIAESATIDSSALVFLIYAFVCLFVGLKKVVFTPQTFGRKVLTGSPILFFVLYTALALLSTLWSVDYRITAFRSIECLSMTLIILAAIQNLYEKGNLRFVILWSLIYAVFEMSIHIISTLRWTTSLEWILVSAQEIATTFFFIAIFFRPFKWYNILVIIMALFSLSTVGYIGMAIGSISFFWIRGRMKLFVILVAIALVITAMLVGPMTIIKNTLFFDKEEVSLSETTGRDFLMVASIEAIKENPFGHGFSAAEPYVFDKAGIAAISAHNSLFSAGLGMGWLGVILFSIFIISIFTTVVSRYIPKDYKPMLIGSAFVAFLHCMGNPSVGSRVFGAWMAGMYIFVLISSFYVYGRYYQVTER